MKKDKKERHRSIRAILKTYDQLTQVGIQQVLKDKYKIDVDRSTISRDLRELGITKNTKKKTLEFTQEGKNNEIKTQILHLFTSSQGKSFYHTTDDKEDQLTMIIFHTNPSTAVSVAILFEQLFDEKYAPFAAFANHSGKIVLIFSIKYRQEISKEIDAMLGYDE